MSKEVILQYSPSKRIVTSNELKSQWKWYKAQQFYRREFIELLKSQKVPKFKTFALELTYNTKHDCDNLSAVAKFFIDTFRELKYAKNDTKAFYKYIKIEGDSSLPKKTLQFKILEPKT